MSRLTAWLRRELPASGARWVEVRDGDDLLARFGVQKAEDIEPTAAAVEEAVGEAEASRVLVVLTSTAMGEGPQLTLHRPKASRSERSTSGLLATVMTENQRLRDSFTELTERTTSALLRENARMAEQLKTYEDRRAEQWATLERLRSEEAERAALVASSDRKAATFALLRDEFVPGVLRHLRSKGGAAQLADIVKAAISAAPAELDALVRKLPPGTSDKLVSMLKEAEAEEASQPPPKKGK